MDDSDVKSDSRTVMMACVEYSRSEIRADSSYLP